MAEACARLGSECWQLMTFMHVAFPAKEAAVEAGRSDRDRDRDRDEEGVGSVSLPEVSTERGRRGMQQAQGLDESKDDDICSPSISIESQTPVGSPARVDGGDGGDDGSVSDGGGRGNRGGFASSPLMRAFGTLGMFKLPTLVEEGGTEGATLQSRRPETASTYSSPFLSPSRDAEDEVRRSRTTSGDSSSSADSKVVVVGSGAKEVGVLRGPSSPARLVELPLAAAPAAAVSMLPPENSSSSSSSSPPAAAAAAAAAIGDSSTLRPTEAETAETAEAAGTEAPHPRERKYLPSFLKFLFARGGSA